MRSLKEFQSVEEKNETDPVNHMPYQITGQDEKPGDDKSFLYFPFIGKNKTKSSRNFNQATTSNGSLPVSSSNDANVIKGSARESLAANDKPKIGGNTVSIKAKVSDYVGYSKKKLGEAPISTSEMANIAANTQITENQVSDRRKSTGYGSLAASGSHGGKNGFKA